MAGRAWSEVGLHRGWDERRLAGRSWRERRLGNVLRQYIQVRYKTIPVATLRLNNALRLPAVPHREAYGAQTALQGGITDSIPLPHLVT
jgi:hypothetical protein